MFGERSFLNLFRDSRTPLDSVRVNLMTLIYFIVQCPSVGTTWYSSSLLFQIPQQLIIVKIRKQDWVRWNSLHFCSDEDNVDLLVGNSSHLLYRHQVFFDIFVFRGSVPCEQGRPEAVFKLVINIFICRASPNVPLVCRAQETSDRLRNLVKLSPHGNHSLNTDLTWPYYVIILKQSRFCERSRPNLVRHAYGTTSKKSNTW